MKKIVKILVTEQRDFKIEDEKLLKDLVKRACEKTRNGKDGEKIYKILEFEDAASVKPIQYVETVYLYINGSVKDEYELFKN